MFLSSRYASSEQSLFQDALGGLVQQMLLGVGNGHQPRLGRVFKMMMTAPDAHQVPAISHDMAYQISAIHITSLWCVGGDYNY
ncbi:hypothetical protein A2T76_18740 [Pseudomonas brenneri]|nr:hypothetical protein A2T76_18740 [Pseudomonas brenneri]